MDTPEELMQEIGSFDLADAKRVLALLEAQQIRFELQMDDSALLDPNRSLQLAFGIYPEGSKIVVFVPESKVAKANTAMQDLFPV